MELYLLNIAEFKRDNEYEYSITQQSYSYYNGF